MKHALAIVLAVLLVPGCGWLDRAARSGALPPGDSITIPRGAPGVMADDPVSTLVPAEEVRTMPQPPLCLWSIACDSISADLDLDGVTTGDDVAVFFSDWSDCDRVDRNGSGCPSCDNDANGECDACDVERFFALWELGI